MYSVYRILYKAPFAHGPEPFFAQHRTSTVTFSKNMFTFRKRIWEIVFEVFQRLSNHTRSQFPTSAHETNFFGSSEGILRTVVHECTWHSDKYVVQHVANELVYAIRPQVSRNQPLAETPDQKVTALVKTNRQTNNFREQMP